MDLGNDRVRFDARMRERILAAAGQHGVVDVRVFGSVARGDSGPDSDVDLLVDVTPGRGFLDIVAFWQDVEELLGRRVDVVTTGGVSPYVRAKIMAEAVPL